jgi:hypothetical protein
MILRVLKGIRFAQLICAAAVFVVGIWLWWRVFVVDDLTGKKLDSREVWFMLLFATPQVLVVVGSFLQSAYRKAWPAALVLLGTVGAICFVVLAAQFAFAYYADTLALRLLRMDLVLIIITAATSQVNAGFAFVLRLSEKASNNSLNEIARE